MEVVGSGREATVYAAGPGRVLRRYRDGRSTEREASAMRFLASRGFPVPAVFDSPGEDLLMERVEGRTMLDELVKHPARIHAYGRLLADLHRQLHAIPPSADMGGPTDAPSIVHFDLHPGNVMMSPAGPVVIDWANVGRGVGDADIAQTWLVMATSPIPGNLPARLIAGLGRRAFLAGFLSATDRVAAAAHLAEVAALRLRMPGLTGAERDRVTKLGRSA